jgi:hypothetical protein
MKYLFIHQNFPAQYRHVVHHLGSQPGNDVRFITQPNENAMSGVKKITYPKDERGPVNCHAYTVEIDRAIYRRDGRGRVPKLRDQALPGSGGGHSGWGETLFIGMSIRTCPARQFQVLLPRQGRRCDSIGVHFDFQRAGAIADA